MSKRAGSRPPANKPGSTPARRWRLETPIRETPARETPAREISEPETLVREAPAREAPARETPVRETSASQQPAAASQAPAREAPPSQPPAQETPEPKTPGRETRETAAGTQPLGDQPGTPQPSPQASPQPTQPVEAPEPSEFLWPADLPEPPEPAEHSGPARRSDAPPWSQVISTTIQLWLGRRLRRGRDAPARPARRYRRWAAAFGLAVVVFAAGALTIALIQHRTGSAANGRAHTGPSQHSSGAGQNNSQPVKLSGPALQAAAHNREQAAAWITAQVSHAAIVSCDPVMCQALTAAAFPAGDLLTLGSSATDPMGSQIVADDTVLRNQLGSKLPSVYAPVILASFGHGTTRVDVRVEAPDGGPAYLLSERADLLARRQSGQELLGSKDLHVAAAARQAIAAGDVDSRLLVTLVALMGQRYPVYVYRFADQAPGATSGVPMRMMRLAGLAQGKSGTSYLHSVLHFLASQQPPYRGQVSVVHLPGDKTSIQIEFAAPSPLGLLGTGSHK